MPLSIATLGPLPKADLAAGAGFYSLTRQLGSSIGIALITTLLTRRIALHRSILVEKITLFRPPAVERIDHLTAAFSGSMDPGAAHRQALGLVDGIVNGQAALLSYSDLFFYVAVLFLLSLPLLLLLGGKNAKNAAASAEAAGAH